MAKTVCRTSIEKALRKSFRQAERGHWYFEDVADTWQVGIGLPNYQGVYEAELWNWDTEESLEVTFSGCYTHTEAMRYGASLLMSEYERRHGRKAA